VQSGQDSLGCLLPYWCGGKEGSLSGLVRQCFDQGAREPGSQGNLDGKGDINGKSPKYHVIVSAKFALGNWRRWLLHCLGEANDQIGRASAKFHGVFLLCSFLRYYCKSSRATVVFCPYYFSPFPSSLDSWRLVSTRVACMRIGAPVSQACRSLHRIHGLNV
jgi:hypothetical protein